MAYNPSRFGGPQREYLRDLCQDADYGFNKLKQERPTLREISERMTRYYYPSAAYKHLTVFAEINRNPGFYGRQGRQPLNDPYARLTG